jgi:hypothetical protein
LARRRFPELDLVPFGVDDPGKLAELRLLEPLEDGAALFLEDLNQGVHVCDAVVDHEGRLARREVITLGRANGPPD